MGLHPACHNGGSGSVHLNVQEAVARGFLVPSWSDPRAVMVRAWGGSKVTLTESGLYVYGEGARLWDA